MKLDDALAEQFRRALAEQSDLRRAAPDILDEIERRTAESIKEAKRAFKKRNRQNS